MKIFNESGKGYWMEECGTLRTEGENRASRPGHVVLDCIGGGGQSNPSVIGCDIYNLSLSGNIAVTVTANACAYSTNAGPTVIVLNDQGGSITDVQDLSATLRAQDHGHPPIVCGLTNRGYDSGDVTETLRAESHNALPIVAYSFEPGIAKRDGSYS